MIKDVAGSDKPFRELCAYIERLKFEDLPEEVVEYTKVLVADYFVASIAGYAYNPEYSLAVKEIISDMGGKEESSVLFSDMKIPASQAAFLNATYCHGADMDDGHHRSEAHLGVTIIPAVFALSETLNVSGKDVITAIVVGYEVFSRVAMAMLPNHMLRGFHVTGTVGAVAAAAACAKLMNFDAERIYTAISLATTQACGLVIVGESGQMCKPLNPARAVETGIWSVKLAAKGVVAFNNPFESIKGYYHSFSDEHDPEMLCRELGTRYEVLNCYIKLYPSCRHTHAGNDAALEIVQQRGLLHDAEEILIKTYPHAVHIVGWNFAPVDKNQAKFSMAYTVGCICLYGKYSLENLEKFPEESAAVIEFAKRIKIEPDESLEDMPNGIRGATMVVKMNDGSEASAHVKMGSGEGDSRVDFDGLRMKARLCAAKYAIGDQIEKMIRYCQTMDKLDEFTTFNIRL